MAPLNRQASARAQCVCFARHLQGFIALKRIVDEANTAVSLCASALRPALNRG